MNAEQKKKLLDHKSDLVAVMHAVDVVLEEEEKRQAEIYDTDTKEFEEVESNVFYLESIKNNLVDAYDDIVKLIRFAK